MLGDLISCDRSTNLIYEHVGVTSSIRTSFASPTNLPDGLAFDGQNLISSCASLWLIHLHEGVSSTIQTSFSAPAFSTRGLAFNGVDLISGDSFSDLIYLHDGITSTIKTSFSTPGNFIGCLAFNGVNLISGDTGTFQIYLHLGFSSTITTNFDAPDPWVAGLTMIGENLASSGTFAPFGEWRVYIHAGVTATVTHSFLAPAAEPTGLAYEYEPPTAPTAPTDLLCNGETNPTKLETLTPHFSAIYNDPDAGDIAQHYRIQVNAESSFTGDELWDSGKTSMSDVNEGERCGNIGYNGSALSRGTTYYWRIKFWDDEGLEGAWSTEPAYFTIAEAPIIPPERKNPVDAIGKVKKARLPLLTRRRELIWSRLITPPIRIILDP